LHPKLALAPLAPVVQNDGDPLMFELSKQFRFDAAHTLERSIDTESSRRIHGHSYRAEVTVRGRPDPSSGMIIDLGLLERKLADARDALDHRFLDEINDLGPATMENLSRWIWNLLSPDVGNLLKVSVYRDSSGEACSYWGEESAG
jgi:6-pyruvoyltetrahydropterin/6-carboxytetrahydropterin synthase